MLYCHHFVFLADSNAGICEVFVVVCVHTSLILSFSYREGGARGVQGGVDVLKEVQCGLPNCSAPLI